MANFRAKHTCALLCKAVPAQTGQGKGVRQPLPGASLPGILTAPGNGSHSVLGEPGGIFQPGSRSVLGDPGTEPALPCSPGGAEPRISSQTTRDPSSL